jgi:hypothetical protein
MRRVTRTVRRFDARAAWHASRAFAASSGGAGTVTSVATGNGLTGGTITTSGTISLDIYTGSNRVNTSFPIGTMVLVSGIPGYGGTGYNLAQAATIYLPTGGAYPGQVFTWGANGQPNTTLSGTWRFRGSGAPNCCGNGFPYLFQRTA